MIKLGDLVKDKISGFTGIATGKTVYLYKAPQIMIEADGLNNGKPIESQWFEEKRIEKVKKQNMGYNNKQKEGK